MPSALDILKVLDRSNCRECGLPTCLAFAAQVARGTRRLHECPRVDPEVAASLGGSIEVDRSGEEAQLRRLAALKAAIAGVDFEDAAARLGGVAQGDRIEIPMLGRIFELDRKGELHSQCHVNTWVHVPLLHYVGAAKGTAPTGDWVHFAELEGSVDWHRFFAHRCEEALAALADEHPTLLADVMRLLHAKPPGGELAARAPKADWSLLLRPLPKVPILVCYWHEDGEFGSQLSLLFDRSLGDNLPAESVWALTRGIVEMCRRVIRRHTHVDV